MPSGHEENGSMAGDKKSGGDKGGQAATIEGRAEEVKKKKRTNPFEFLRQVRAEAEKVTWTSWKETRISTLMVLVMVIIMA
ncbi:MAG: preprotein translocase subunit SecE, partial [Parvularculaceae bacterium]